MHGQAGCCSSTAITHKPRGLTGHQGHPFTFTQPILIFSASCVKSGLVSSLAGASADCRLLVHRPGVCLPSDLSAEAGLAAVSCPANWTTLGCTTAVMTSLQFPPTGGASQHHGDSLLDNRQGAPRGSPLQELSRFHGTLLCQLSGTSTKQPRMHSQEPGLTSWHPPALLRSRSRVARESV